MSDKEICERCGEPYEDHTCYWQPCPGCKDGHSSFHRTIILSQEWEMWRKEQKKRMLNIITPYGIIDKKKPIFDMPEVEECGIISPGHWKEFIKFIVINKYIDYLK